MASELSRLPNLSPEDHGTEKLGKNAVVRAQHVRI